MAQALALRAACFRATRGQTRPEADRFDPLCQHYLIESEGKTLATFRVQLFRTGAELGQSYAAQFYNLRRLETYGHPVLELGRFCLAPDAARPADVLRLAWAALTGIVDAQAVRLLIGCTSFDGADAARHAAALALLRGYAAPAQLAPDRRGEDRISLPEKAPGPAALPPLLRSYLAMGGWVSDHAVLDHDLDTLHVFTGLEVDRIPPSRARALRALASEAAKAQVTPG